MRTYTGFPHPNILLAKRIISEMAPRLFADDGHRWMFYGLNVGEDGMLRDKIVDLIIGEFMVKHPRGKGTAGNEDMRRFYAACHAIQGTRSRTSSKRHRDEGLSNHIDSFSKGLHSALLSFPEDGSPLPYPTRATDDPTKPVFDGKLITKMADQGFITGMYEVRGTGFSPVEMWLTDKGLLMRAAAVSLRKRKKAMEIKPGLTHQEETGEWTSTVTTGGKVVVAVTRETSEAAIDLRDKIIVLMRNEVRR